MTIELNHTVVAVDGMKINHRGGGRGLYLPDPDGHTLELLTVG